MAGWPWPDEDVDYVFDRGDRALRLGREGAGMIRRFLIDLALPMALTTEPVRDLHAWAKRRSMTELRELILANELRRAAQSATRTGWRRGDIINLRTRARWPQRTT